VKVVHVIPSVAARTGGPAAAVVELARTLERRGIESPILATDMAFPAQTGRSDRVTPADLPPRADEAPIRLFPAQRPYRLAYAPELGRALRETVEGADAVHVHSLYLYPQLAAFREAARRGIPYVVSPRGALDPWLRRRGRARKALVELLWQRRMLEGASALHFTSEEEARLVADVAPGVPRLIVPNGIRWRDFQELPHGDAFRARELGGHTGPVVLNLGRLAAKKGLDLLVRAFARVAAQMPDARLVLAGPDDEGRRPVLAALAKREGAQVTFAGMLRGGERLEALAAADVWALSSHTENFGFAVVEALAAGLPVVISPAVNLASEIETAGAGVVCELEPGAFGDAILSLLCDERRRREIGERAREFARRYDWDALAPQIVEMYEAVAGRRVEDPAREAEALL
jgi:glycosyltransferase involved in cell wall biosynthesis